MQAENYDKNQIDRSVNMIIVAGGLNGVIRVYHNEVLHSSPGSPLLPKNRTKQREINIINDNDQFEQ